MNNAHVKLTLPQTQRKLQLKITETTNVHLKRLLQKRYRTNCDYTEHSQ